jgi:hypothetical protein
MHPGLAASVGRPRLVPPPVAGEGTRVAFCPLPLRRFPGLAHPGKDRRFCFGRHPDH